MSKARIILNMLEASADSPTFDIFIPSYYNPEQEDRSKKNLDRLLGSMGSIKNYKVFIYAQKWPQEYIKKFRDAGAVVKEGQPGSGEGAKKDFIGPRAGAFSLAVREGSGKYLCMADDDFEFKGEFPVKDIEKIFSSVEGAGIVVMVPPKHVFTKGKEAKSTNSVNVITDPMKSWTGAGIVIPRDVANKILSKFKSVKSSFDDPWILAAAMEQGFKVIELVTHGGPKHHAKMDGVTNKDGEQYMNPPKKKFPHHAKDIQLPKVSKRDDGSVSIKKSELVPTTDEE